MSPAQQLTNALSGKWHASYGTAACPAHDNSRPSLSIRDGDRRVILTCHAGCASDEIVRELRSRRLWPIDGATDTACAAPTSDQRREWALRIWREAHPIADTTAETYLRSRGITIPLPPTLRFCGALKHGPTGLYLPALVAAVQAPTREVIAVHRTYLTETGRKSPIGEAKMGLGSYGAGAVRLAKAEIELGLAEGIETALSAMALFNIPCWASLGGERLCKIELPPDVARVTIFADNGPPGRAAAMAAVEAFTRQRRKVVLKFPPADLGDFNDLLQKNRVAA